MIINNRYTLKNFKISVKYSFYLNLWYILIEKKEIDL